MVSKIINPSIPNLAYFAPWRESILRVRVFQITGKFARAAKNFVGQNFWARGYYVSTVGRDEAEIRHYIREQEREDKRLDQLKMFE